MYYWFRGSTESHSSQWSRKSHSDSDSYSLAPLLCAVYQWQKDAKAFSLLIGINIWQVIISTLKFELTNPIKWMKRVERKNTLNEVTTAKRGNEKECEENLKQQHTHTSHDLYFSLGKQKLLLLDCMFGARDVNISRNFLHNNRRLRTIRCV